MTTSLASTSVPASSQDIMMPTPVNEDTITPLLQSRIIRLLFLLDRSLFDEQYHTFFSGTHHLHIPLLEHYVHYLKFLKYSDELLDDIMPRIRRRLSLQSRRMALYETAPTSGTIDWQRSLQRTWNTTPGMHPLRFDTHLRQRSTASRENIFAVAVLQHYHKLLRDVLSSAFADEPLTDLERPTFGDIEERIERELAEPYAQTLLREVQATDVETLAEQLTLHLRPGPNPYYDLLTWWEKCSRLRIGPRLPQQGMNMTFANKQEAEQQNSRLYSLWIALELLYFLRKNSCNLEMDTFTFDKIQCTFTWSNAYLRFEYTKQINKEEFPKWRNAPDSCPTFLLERVDSLRVPIDRSKPLIWREPPILLETSYRFHPDTYITMNDTIKQLIGDMTLLGAEQGILFCPQLPAPEQSTGVARQALKRHASDELTDQHYYSGMGEKLSVQHYELRPSTEQHANSIDPTPVQRSLSAVLDMVVAELEVPTREDITCHGIWLGPGMDITSNKKEAASSQDKIQMRMHNIICHKPHIGTSVFDLVSFKSDCNRNNRLCHIMGRSEAPSMMPLSEILTDLINNAHSYLDTAGPALQQAENASDDDAQEKLYSQVMATLAHSIEYYTNKNAPNLKVHDDMLKLIFGEYWDNREKGLDKDTKTMLITGQYMWYDFFQTLASSQQSRILSSPFDDWSIVGVMYCRALEHELKKRLYESIKLRENALNWVAPDRWTLGTPGKILRDYERLRNVSNSHLGASSHRNHDRNRSNLDPYNSWRAIKSCFIKDPTCNDTDDTHNTARKLIDDVTDITTIRNAIAHGHVSVSQEQVQVLHTEMIEPGHLLHRILKYVKPPTEV